MLRTKAIFILVFVLGIISSQKVGVAPCPLQYELGSVISVRITIAQQKGIVPLVNGQDVQCYNYSLPYPFARVPEVAIGIHDFQAQKTDDIFFSIKPIKTQSLSFLPMLIRTQWKYTQWKKISFSILVEDRRDLESGYYQVDSGSLGGCQPGKTLHVLLPFRQITVQGNISHNIFLSGFQISSQFYTADQQSPFELQVLDTRTNSSGIAVFFTVTTITQVHAIHLSYIAWQATTLNIVSGQYASEIMSQVQITHSPESNIGRNYARIFGITGFIINHNERQIFFSTQWSGSKFTFDFDASTPFVKYISFEYLFFLGSECSDCLNYPYIFNGECKQICPEGYHATGENVCIDCGQGHYWNGTACIKECPQDQFLNIALNECQCPVGLNWNGAKCISCVGGKIFNTSKNICECPQNTRWNGYGCATVEECKNGEEWNVFKFMCECPLNSYWNGTYCVKVITCKNGQVLDKKKGCICPPGTHWNGEWCETHSCRGGQVWNGSECVCQPGYNFNGTICLLCINGQEWNPISRTCDCPPGFIWNGNYCKRVVTCSGGRVYNETIDQCLCPLKHFWNGFQCMVKPDCCCGKVWNETSFECNCPANFNWDGQSCVLCLNGKVWDDKTNKCVCREGTKWNGHFCVVIQDCFGGTIWNQNTWSCECPSITVWNGRYCVANPCVGGQLWNALKRKCQCPNNLAFINGLCQNPATFCTPPKTFNSFFGFCVCPPGTFDSGTSCVQIPICEGDKFIDPLSGDCICESGLVFLENVMRCGDPTCPENERWNGFGCVKIQCPPNSYYNGSECVCPDPKDYCQAWQYYDGIRCVYQPGSCPSGTTWNGTFCAADKSCPAGFYSLGSSCMPLPQRCIPPTYWANDRCQITNNCPHGTYFRSGNCMPYVPCQNGQKWDNNMVNCICPEGTEWNGAKCLACQGGKSWQPFVGCVCPTGYFFSGSRCDKVNATRCGLIPNALWDGTQCLCHEGFHVVGMQCVCDGVVVTGRCDRCAHKPNSQWRYGECRCKPGYTDFNTECLGNQIGHNKPEDCQVSSFYDSQQKMCLPCPSGCLSCKSSYICEQCRPQFNFDVASQLCIEFCGDGKKFVLECDDGNNVNNDGCSFSCTVEPGYVCRGGSPNQPDSCVLYQPTAVSLIQTGHVRYATKIVVNVRLDFMPKALIQSTDCNDRCSNVLDGKIVSGDMDAVSIKSTYISGSTYSFSIAVDFGRSYIGKFTLQVKVNPSIAAKYYNGVDASTTLMADVNPAFLAKVDEDRI